ncbi:MAG: encodes protein latent cycle [Myxococcaceae bacterium]|nr:encodes protein latent cycle [Myxococcaceae bacterium]
MSQVGCIGEIIDSRTILADGGVERSDTDGLPLDSDSGARLGGDGGAQRPGTDGALQDSASGEARDAATGKVADAGPDTGTTPIPPKHDGGVVVPLGDAAVPNYNPCPPAGTPCKIMPVGDSITAGWLSTDEGGFRTEIFHQALQHGQSMTFVGPVEGGPDKVDGVTFPRECAGYLGYTIDPGGDRDGISPLIVPAMTMNKPHIITLMIGTNDVNINLDLPNAPTRLAALVDTILATDPKVLLILTTIIPTYAPEDDVPVAAYNAAMPALVAQRAQAGKHIVLIDMHALLAHSPNFPDAYMADGLHPNDAGYVLLGDAFYKVIGPLLH